MNWGLSCWKEKLVIIREGVRYILGGFVSEGFVCEMIWDVGKI